MNTIEQETIEQEITKQEMIEQEVIEQETIEQEVVEHNVTKLEEALRLNMLGDKLENMEKCKNGERLIGYQRITWTPDLAKYILKYHNNDNRPINRPNVDYILKEIDGGNWTFNGATISFDDRGNLTNGQHRLTAISEREQSFQIPTYTNLDHREALKTTDTGKGRSASDILGIRGVDDPKVVASSVMFVNELVHNSFQSKNRGSKISLSTSDVCDYYDMLGEDEIVESIKFYNDKKVGINLMKATTAIGFHYALTTIEPERGEIFMGKLLSGVGLEERCPITLLRIKLSNAKATNGKKDKLNEVEIIKFVLYTWFKYIKGDKMKQLKLPKDFSSTIDFSVIPKFR